MHLFGFHEGRTKSALEKFIEGTIDTKDDGGHSLFSENFATRFGRRFGHKKEQDKSQQETEEKNYRNDEYSICSDEKPSEFLGDEYEHSQKILFKRMLKATFLYWKREGKNVAGVFSKHCSLGSDGLALSQFEAACKELGCPLCRKELCNDWPRLGDGDFQMILEMFDTTDSGYISLERLKLFIQASKDTENKGFGVEPLPDQLAQFSVFCLDFHHPIRQFFLGIAFHSVFQRFILLVILANSIIMAIVDYSVVDVTGNPCPQGWNYNKVDSNGNPVPAFSLRNLILQISEPIFTAIFTLECVVRIMALGFAFGECTYLRSGWNCLDFLVVVTSLISFLPGGTSLRILKIFRVLRPLKAMSKLEGLRVIIQALLRSLKGLGSALIIFSFFLFLFIAVGIDLFAGEFYSRCRSTPFPVLLNSSCLSAYDSCWPEYIKEVTAHPDSWRCLDVPNDDPNWTKLGSPWSKRQDCIWPVAPEIYYNRICNLNGGGVYNCPASTTCGSNYDASGNPRFISSSVPFGIDRMAMDTFYGDFDSGFVVFDNFGAAFLAVFQMITLTDWYQIMSMGMDSVGAGQSAIFCIFAVFIGNWILVNLLLGVLTDGLSDEHENTVKNSVDIWEDEQDQRSYVWDEKHPASHRLSVEEPDNIQIDAKRERSLEDTNCKTLSHSHSQTKLQVLVDGSYFSGFMMLCIFMNTVVLAMDHYPETNSFVTQLGYVNFVLTIIFAIEMVLIIAAHGLMAYIRDTSNLFDALIVVLGLIEMIIELSGSSGNRGITVLRTFRMFRLLKLAKKSKDLQELLKNMISTFLQMGNFALLLCLFIYIFALIGMEIFANTLHFDPITGVPVPFGSPEYAAATIPVLNFDTFFMAFVTVFCELTFENWDTTYYNCRLATSNLTASLYFVVLLAFGAYVLMNVFVGILLTNFASNGDEKPAISNETVENTQTQKEPSRRKVLARIFGSRSSLFKKGLFQNAMLQKPFKSFVNHSSFEAIVLLIVVLSTITLCLDNPLNNPNGTLQRNLTAMNLFFAVFFSGEALLKIIGLGHDYFTDNWNLLDFIVTALSVIALFPLGKASRLFKMARVFRPVRLVNKVPSLKHVVIIIFKSLPTMANVLFLILMVFLIFSIFSVSFLKGALYSCQGSMTDDQLELLTSPVPWEALTEVQISWFNGTRCSNSESYPKQPTSHTICDCWFDNSWSSVLAFPLNFNNVLSGLCTFFEISTTSGWEDVMFAASSQRGVDFQPVLNNNLGWVVFFIIFMLIGFLFLVNAFVGAIVDFFNRERKAGGQDTTFASQAQREWVEIRYLITRMIAQRKIPKPTSFLRKKIFEMVVPDKDPGGASGLSKFEICSLSVICLNGLVLAVSYFGQSDAYANALANLNIGCGLFFNLEAILKLVACHIFYFADPWNRLDFTVVACTDISYFASFVVGKTIPFLGMFARVLRLLRLFQVITRVQGVKLLFESLLSSLPGFINVAFLLLLVMFIYAVAGVELFSTIAMDSYVTAHQNFQSFQNALLVLFRIATGDNWNYFVHSMQNPSDGCVNDPPFNPNWCEINNNAPNCVPLNGCGNAYSSIPFFYTYFLIVSHILVNLFIGVILDGMQNGETKLNFSLVSRDAIRDYNAVWDKIDASRKNYISAYLFPQLLKLLDEPFGLNENDRCNMETIHAFIERLNIPTETKDSTECLTYRAITEALAKEILRKVHGETELEAAKSQTRTISHRLKTMLSRRNGFRLQNNIQNSSSPSPES